MQNNPDYTLTEDSSRTIVQLHYLAWPDHQISEATTLLKLIDITLAEKTIGPLVVHCSAGCGRTAAFLTVLSTIHLLTHPSKIIPTSEDSLFPPDDLVALQINRFRNDRIGSVQTRSQFIFCYDAVISKLGTMFNAGVERTWEI